MTRELSLSASNLVQSQFIGKDYDTFLQSIFAGLQQVYPNQTIPLSRRPSAAGIVPIEVIAALLSEFSWMVDRIVDDSYLDISRFRDTLVKVSRNYGYKSRGAIAPSFTLSISLDSPAAANFTIPAGETLSGSGLTYQTQQAVAFQSGESGPKTVTAFEAQSLRESFISNGNALQTFQLQQIPTDRFVVDQSLSVRVGGEFWSEVDILTVGTDKIFEVLYGADPVEIRFGSGEVGKIPPSGSQIVVDYKATLGTTGTAVEDEITAFDRSFSVSGSSVDPTLTHTESTPGSDRETMDEIRYNAQNLFLAGERGVSIADIDAIANAYSSPTFGAIAKATTTVSRTSRSIPTVQTFIDRARASSHFTDEEVDDFETFCDNVFSTDGQAMFAQTQILSTDTIGRYVSAPRELAESLEAYLNNGEVTSPIMRIEVIDGIDQVYQLNTSAVVRYTAAITSATQMSNVLSNVESAIQELLIGREFGASLYLSDVYEILEAITGVSSVTFQITGYDNRADYPASITDAGDLVILESEVITMGQTPVVTGA